MAEEGSQGKSKDGATFFKLSRTIFESSIWRASSDELKLFIYLIGQARWSSEPRHYGTFTVNRGDVLTSLSKISDDNGGMRRGRFDPWSRHKCSRVLNKLQDLGLIEVLADTYGTHIKIINYDTYQDGDTYKRTDPIHDPRMNRASSAHDPRTNRAQEKKDNKDKNGKKDKNNKKEPIFPPQLENPDCKKAWDDFHEHRKALRKPLTPKAQEMILAKFSTRPQVFIHALNESIQNGWTGVFEPKSGNSPPNRVSQNVRNQQATVQAVKEILEGNYEITGNGHNSGESVSDLPEFDVN